MDRAEYLLGTTRKDLQKIIHRHVTPGATVNTDEHKGYVGVGDLFCKLDLVKHSKGHYVDSHAHTNSTESY